MLKHFMLQDVILVKPDVYECMNEWGLFSEKKWVKVCVW